MPHAAITTGELRHGGRVENAEVRTPTAKKAKCDVKRDIFTDVSNTVIKGGFQTLKRSIREKCKVEVNSATDIQKVLAERADSVGGFAVEGPLTVILFDEWSKRQTRAAVSRAARDVARNKHVKSRRGKQKGAVHTTF